MSVDLGREKESPCSSSGGRHIDPRLGDEFRTEGRRRVLLGFLTKDRSEEMAEESQGRDRVPRPPLWLRERRR